MFLEVMKALGARAHEWSAHPPLQPSATPTVALASLGIPDTIFIFVVALVVFGPKRLPEIGKQIGKLIFEFRRASNDFKLQIEDELRLSEQQERQKTLEAQAAAAAKAAPAPAVLGTGEAAAASDDVPDNSLVIQQPSTGTVVEGRAPNRAVTEAGFETEPTPPARERIPEPRGETNGTGGSTPEIRAAIARGTTVVEDEAVHEPSLNGHETDQEPNTPSTAASESAASQHG